MHVCIHSDHFYSASSNPLLLRSAPDTARILCRSFTPKRHRQLWVKDLPKVPTWRLERESNPRPSGWKLSTQPMRHLVPQGEVCMYVCMYGMYVWSHFNRDRHIHVVFRRRYTIRPRLTELSIGEAFERTRFLLSGWASDAGRQTRQIHLTDLEGDVVVCANKNLRNLLFFTRFEQKTTSDGNASLNVQLCMSLSQLRAMNSLWRMSLDSCFISNIASYDDFNVMQWKSIKFLRARCLS